MKSLKENLENEIIALKVLVKEQEFNISVLKKENEDFKIFH